eukprot:763877-Hanusia_phi.AAC.1
MLICLHPTAGCSRFFPSKQDEDFMQKFTSLYEAHVEFGSTGSGSSIWSVHQSTDRRAGKAFLKGMKRERDKDML